VSFPPILVDAELTVPTGIAQLIHLPPSGPSDRVMQQRSDYWLDMCLTPRPLNARACYQTRWHRFEPLGRVFLVPPGQTIRFAGEGGPQQVSILCLLNAARLQQWLGTDFVWTEGQLKDSLDIRNSSLSQLLTRLARELREPGFASAMMVELITAEVAIEVCRYRQMTQGSRSAGLAAWRLQRIDDRLSQVAKPPSLVELAALCSLSVRQLTRAFRISRGCSIGQYVEDGQLEHAKRMLAGDSSIKRIALTLGFSSPSSFCCAFRRSTHQTPSQFRERLLQVTGKHRN
jgi:AraC family transcriptional regulator